MIKLSKNLLPQISLAIENSQDDTLTLLERAITEDESTPTTQTVKLTIRIETQSQRSIEDVR